MKQKPVSRRRPRAFGAAATAPVGVVLSHTALPSGVGRRLTVSFSRVMVSPLLSAQPSERSEVERPIENSVKSGPERACKMHTILEAHL